MAPSKHWMSLVNECLNPEYEKGVREFITFAFGQLGNESEVTKCPCVRCKNSSDRQYSAETIEDHLIAYGILLGYTLWCHHGETAGENQLEFESVGCHDGNEDKFNQMEAEENKIDDEIDAMLMERFQMFNDLCMGEVSVDSSRSIEFEKEANDEAKKSIGYWKNCNNLYMMYVKLLNCPQLLSYFALNLLVGGVMNHLQCCWSS